MRESRTYLQRVMEHAAYFCVSEGRPRKAMPYKHAKREDHASQAGFQKPATASWPVLLSAAQMWELLEGFVPTATNDDYFVYSEFAYSDENDVFDKPAPHNVNGKAKIHICKADSGHEVFQIDLDVERIDIVAASHPNTKDLVCSWAPMICGVISKISWETSEEIVGASVDEASAKAKLRDICRKVLDVHLLVKGIEPIKMEDRSSVERMKQAAKEKLDMQMAMQRLMSGKLRLLTGVGTAGTSAMVSRMLAGKDARKFLQN